MRLADAYDELIGNVRNLESTVLGIIEKLEDSSRVDNFVVELNHYLNLSNRTLKDRVYSENDGRPISVGPGLEPIDHVRPTPVRAIRLCVHGYGFGNCEKCIDIENCDGCKNEKNLDLDNIASKFMSKMIGRAPDNATTVSAILMSIITDNKDNAKKLLELVVSANIDRGVDNDIVNIIKKFLEAME